MTASANIVEAMTSPEWWGPWFARGDWGRWHVFLRALFGLPMAAGDLSFYREFTGCIDWPGARAQEAYASVGRRGGKTRVMALVAAWLAAFEDWRPFLSPGETAHVLLVAKDQAQAGVAFGYLASLFLDHPVLKQLVVAETQDSLTLSNRVIVRVAAASFRGLRGYAIAALLADELGYWFDGEISANPAEEILAAVRPAMLQFGGRGMLLCGSSPYRRTGPLWDAYRRHYGQPTPILFWKASTAAMNPQAPADEIARAYEEDPQAAAAEYGAEFRTDLAAFVDREVVEALIELGCYERPPAHGVSYLAGLDVSGGSQDSMALAISHLDPDGTAVLDLVREIRPPFSPEAATSEFAETCRAYGVSRVVGDRYGGEWPREAFGRHGIAYDIADRTKSDYYRDLLPALNSSKVSLLDNRRLVTQLCSLERRVARGGRDSIDHAPSGRDDVANASAISLVLVASATAPALWRPGDLLADDAPLPWPRLALYTFASAAADMGGLAVFYWAQALPTRDGTSGPAFLIDYDLALPMTPALFPAIRDRLHELAGAGRARVGPLFTTGPLAAQARVACEPEALERLSRGDIAGARRAQLIVDACAGDLLADRDALAQAAAVAIGSGRIKVAAPAHEKSKRSPLPLFAFRPGAPAEAASDGALVGIGVTVDRRALLSIQM